MAQDLIQRRRDGASALADLVTTYVATSAALTETLAQLAASGGSFEQTDFDGTDLAYVDAGVLNYLRDQVWPNLEAARAAPFDGVAGHESNLTLLRKLARIGG